MKLSDCCLKIGSGATPRGGKSSYLEEGPFSLIRSQNIHNNLFARAGLAFISDEQAKQLQNVDVQPNDVLLNITGDSVARVCQVPEDVLPARVNQHVAIIRPDSSKLIHKYLHYFLVNPKMQTYMLNLASAGATRNALTKGMIESFEVPATSIDEQKAIASVLGALDDKIENNRQMNETLEELARAIFKSWFVDFDPVHAKAAGNAPAHMDAETAALFPSSFGDDGLPVGWETSNFEDLIEFRNGYAFKSKELSKDLKSDFAIFKMGHIKVGGGFNPNYKTDHLIPKASPKMKEFILKTGDILMSMTDMKDNVRLLGHTALFYEKDANFLVNQRVGLIKAKKEITNYPYIYCLTNNQTFLYEIRKRANSGVQVNLSTVGIKTTPTIMPPLSLMAKFGSLSIPIFERIFESERESKTLAELRDTLLPKLMSGEIRVADAEREVEAAI
ncbi:restriction endonuclease subunit S [Pseudomonadales bacterium]|nr:restriction endonuclease subunit S [Pseudomonadales bacterium]